MVGSIYPAKYAKQSKTFKFKLQAVKSSSPGHYFLTWSLEQWRLVRPVLVRPGGQLETRLRKVPNLRFQRCPKQPEFSLPFQ